MRPFAYAHADTVDDALATLASRPHGAFLAGGTNIVDLIKIDVESPDTLIDINALPLGRIETLHDGTIRIGALARMSDTADHPAVRAAIPAAARALNLSASPQLRNMASIGGNLMQRTRCVYFRDVSQPCNKRRNGEGCSAQGGDDRRMAILGASARCICTHPSDFAVAMLLTDATIHVRGAGGARTMPLLGFHRLPGDDPTRDTNLGSGEIIEAISFVPSALTRNSSYVKVRDRASYEFALVSAAAALDVRGGTIREARVAVGGIAPVPWRAKRAEAALIGKPASRAAYLAAAEAEMAAANPLRLNGFKTLLARNAIARALGAVGGAA
ncbi:MAG TPA: xanthine dehydrogenase family protein subunit M [Candidatus Baltobacteraceae bacterium]|nr:xanthine dehydrogenase family protein subunit M [Candidatus Baltobacteraceae bacterium]